MSKPITRVRAVSLVDPNAPGIVSAYDFRRTATKGRLEDLVGSNDGTAVGGLDYVQSRWGTGIRSDGSGLVNLGTGFNAQTCLCVSMWYRHRTTTGVKFLMNQYADATSGYGVIVNGDAISIFDDINNAGATRYSETLVNGAVYHIEWGIKNDKTCRLFVNGQPSDNDEKAAASFNSVGGSMYILSKDGTTADSPPGEVYNVEVFSEDLDDAVIATYYNRGRRIKSFFDRGLIASGNDFGAGSFIENSNIRFTGTAGTQKIAAETVNGCASKVLQTGTSISATAYSFLPSSEFGVNKKQAAYGTWNFTIHNSTTAGYYPLFAMVGTPARSSYNYGVRILSTAKDTLQFVRFGGTVLGTASITVGSFPSVRVCRYSDNRWKWWVDGVYAGTFTDDTFTESTGMWFFLYGSDVKIVLQSDDKDCNFWYSPLVIEP